MGRRKSILPRRLVDCIAILAVIIILPGIIVFELCIVLPDFHEPGSFWYKFTLTTSAFLVFNVVASVAYCVLLDTTVEGAQLQRPQNLKKSGWHECAECKDWQPPRSWHCPICKTCILKRDHHCVFLGCCIGHANQRYFVMFLFYVFACCTYSFVYDVLYFCVNHAETYVNIMTLLKIIFPPLMFFNGLLNQNLYILCFKLNFAAWAFSLILFCYLGIGILRGGVSVEMEKHVFLYDNGWYSNLNHTFGDRMFIAWISPLIPSKLPNNGADWPIRPNLKTDEIKTENTTNVSIIETTVNA